MWFRLASKLKMPLQLVKESTTSSEFSRWMVFLEQEEKKNIHKYELYAAAILAEIRRSWVADSEVRESINPLDFVIWFDKEDKPNLKRSIQDKEEYSEEHYKRYTAVTKNKWLGFLGVKDKKGKKNG